MRVLLAHNRYRSVGGEERHIDLLAKWLPDAGIQVRRFEIDSPTDPAPLERLKLGSTLAYRRSGARLLREVLVRERPDVVHFHNVFPLLTPAAIREARRYGAAVVLTIHNYRFACPAGTLLRNGRIHEDCIEGSSLMCGLRNARGVWSESIAYGIALEIQRRLRMLQRWVDAYVAPSRFVARMLQRAGYPEDRIHTISHATEIAVAPSPPGDYALYAGRLSPEKGTKTLVTASRLAPDVPLVVAGDGPMGPLVRRATGPQFTYLGRLDSRKVTELMQGAAFTMMPSECYENQPFAALESMAVGTPLLASKLGGLAEIIDDGVTGVLAPPSDPTALARAMEAMWADKDAAAAMGDRAWRFARDHFAPSVQTSRLLALYEQVCSMPR